MTDNARRDGLGVRGALVRPETMSERGHRLLYLGVQRLRGRRIGAYLCQLQTWERLEPEVFQRLRAERLARTLEYASSRVPLYGSGRWREALERSDLRDLQAWPVLDREMIKAHLAELIARPAPAAHYIRRTSGSSGTPLEVAIDLDAASWAGQSITAACSGTVFMSARAVFS
jgi:phenylacetate-coenzyme A ligase PaaK-like adenylate-forming protein